MIKKFFKFILYLIFFFAMILLFLPKENLYYKAEELLQPLKIVIAHEKVNDKGFSLAIEGADIYAMDGIKVAHVQELELSIFLLLNKIDVENIELTSVASKFVPTHIDRVNIVYSVMDPLIIHAVAVGDFGEADATINLKERLLHAELLPSKLLKTRFKSTMRMLKKSKEGAYTYEQRF